MSSIELLITRVNIQWSMFVLAAAVLLSAGSPAASTDKSAEGRNSGADFVAWASSAAIRLRTVEPGGEDGDLAPFCDMVGRAPVVALGEPGHGAHEPLALRNRLFFHLVEHCGFTAIVLETSFTESRAIYHFVAGGPGDAADIARRYLTWGFGRYDENAQLLQWMRDYNRVPGTRQRSSARRAIHFYGMDLSGADHDGGFSGARVALDDVVQYAATADAKDSRKLLAELAPVLGRISTVGYAGLAESHDPALDAALDLLDSFLKTHAAALRRASSHSQYDWAAHNVIVARQLRDVLSLGISSQASSTTILPDDYRLDDVRDAGMAANALWAMREEGEEGRLLVFAHNGHVMNAPTLGGIWSVYSQPPRTMGQNLRAALGGSLVIIGTIAAHSGGGLPEGGPLENGMDDSLARLGLPLFALDLRGARHNPGALGWLGERRPLRANFDSELDISPRDAFDLLVYIDRVHPARQMEVPRVH
jgi:erythromycin esterase